MSKPTVVVPPAILARSDAASAKAKLRSEPAWIEVDAAALPDSHTDASLSKEPGQHIALQAELSLLDAVDRREAGLPPKQFVQRDFFVCDFVDVSFRDDVGTMDAPMFSLSKKKDLQIWAWESDDGLRKVEVIPSVLGRATMYDKDVLIYLATQITHGLNTKRDDAMSKRVRFTVYGYLTATGKATGKGNYEAMEAALARLKGTTISTNIKTGGVRIKESFNIIDKVSIVEKSPTDERMVAIEVTLSDWFYNALQAREILTLNPQYFRLKKGLEKRLYEIARKFCGDKATFVIGDNVLYRRTGSRDEPRKLRFQIKAIAEQDNLPDYSFSYSEEKKQWTITNKDPRKLLASSLKNLR